MDVEQSTTTAPASPANDRSSPVPLETRIGAAVHAWTNELIDVGGRNNLLFYRDLRTGTLDLGAAREPTIEALLAGKPVRLSNLFPDVEQRKDALRRARAIYSKAREHFEEKGIATLFIACGMATWKNPRSTSEPMAPVLLRSAEFHQRGAAQEDFELVLTGEMEVNPILLHVFKSDFARDIAQETLLDRLDGVIDTPWELQEVYSWLATEARMIPGFGVRDRMVIGNFLYAKLPMVRDLDGALSVLAKHDVIASLAGDAEARARLRSRNSDNSSHIDEPDLLRPEEEFLVLDADSSQNLAINKVLRGQDLIIKGPPGTGKSQTIANLITSLLGRGKKVLFVAEKRAAIDAVLQRLAAVGLSDLVLDVHGGGSTRRQIAENLNRALVAMASTPVPRQDGLPAELVKLREKLRDHATAMHTPREPWGISADEAIRRASMIPEDARTDFRIDLKHLEKIDRDQLGVIAEALQTYLDLGGARYPFSPWADAAVDDQAEVESALALVGKTRHVSIPGARDALWRALGETGVSDANDAAAIADRLAIWGALESFLRSVAPAIFELDLDALVVRLAPAKGPLDRIVALITSADYRAARRQVREVAPEARNDAELLAVAETALSLRTRSSQLGSGPIPTVPTNLGAAVEAERQAVTDIGAVAALVGWGDVTTTDRTEIAESLDGLLADRQTLLRAPEFRRTRKTVSSAGVEPLLKTLTSTDKAGPEGVIALIWAWLNSIIERIEVTDPVLATFDADQLRATAHRFATVDREHIARTAARVRRLYAEQGVKERDLHPDESSLVKAQAARKRGHLPLREMFRNAPHALLAVKPCWAMSPLLVSQILPSDRKYFDVVIFDEASQVTPADAVPSIMRGHSVVVAGDDKQLPPTRFFMATQPEDETSSTDEIGELDLVTGFESVLDTLAAILPETRLDWHYRSQDERLINFSNANYYDGRLVTFPGVAGRGSIRHVLAEPSTNPDQRESASKEVEAVVRLVLEHAEQNPAESLGVIAMGITHANRIEEALRGALAARPELDGFFDETRRERFFVKNLERVQGDERDAIILSVGYGKGPDGRLFYRFGPINLEGGERRLNVAVTRARRRMTVVSSFTAAEMDPTRLRGRGPQLLRDYLAYAATSGRTSIRNTDPDPDDGVSTAIAEGLAQRGVPADIRVGESSHAIDVAVRDPQDASTYLLAVETDGSSYQTIPTTRDRERLRAEQLKRLGWQHRRVWGMEWHRDAPGSTERILGQVRAALEGVEDEPLPEPSSPPATEATTASARAPRPPLGAYWKIDDIPPRRLVDLIDWIESDGVLRTEDELVRVGVQELGFQRLGARIDEALRSAIATARKRRGR
jgi:hypothetical protein